MVRYVTGVFLNIFRYLLGTMQNYKNRQNRQNYVSVFFKFRLTQFFFQIKEKPSDSLELSLWFEKIWVNQDFNNKARSSIYNEIVRLL